MDMWEPVSNRIVYRNGRATIEVVNDYDGRRGYMDLGTGQVEEDEANENIA